MIPFATWDPLNLEERVSLLNERCGNGPRDGEDHALVSTDHTALTKFVGGITNVMQIREGNAAGTDEEGNEYPARGKPGHFYTRYREGEEIERGPGIDMAVPRDALAVCGEWAGGTPPGISTGRRLAINTRRM